MIRTANRTVSRRKLSAPMEDLARSGDGMGRIGKGQTCSVENCSKEAVRSVSAVKAAEAGLKLSDPSRGYLCADHYKEYKKKSKKSSRLEKWRFNTFK